MQPRKSFLTGCFLGIVLGAVGLFGGIVGGAFLFKDVLIAKKEGELRSPPITVGLEADYNWTVKRLTGDGETPLDMKELQGQTVFLHFWSPNCLHCLAELPTINRLYQSVGGEEIAFICVARSGEEKLRKLADEYALSFPLFACSGTLPKVFAESSAPNTFIIAPSGDIAFKHQGSAKWDDPSVSTFLLSLSAMTAKSETE